MSPETAVISSKHKYSEEEKNKIGSVLAEKHIKITELGEQMKLASAGYKRQIQGLKNDVSVFSINLTNGYEYRDYKCTVKFNYKKKTKSYYEVNTGKLIETRPFAPEDYQRSLPLSEVKKKAAEKSEEFKEQLAKAREIVKTEGTSTTALQKKMGIGYTLANQLIEALEKESAVQKQSGKDAAAGDK